MNTTRIMAGAGARVASGVARDVMTPTAQPPGIMRTDVLRHDLGVPGREVIQVRVDFAPEVAFGRHSHPGAEIAYVLEGTLEYELEGKSVTIKAGESLFIPSGAIHAANRR